jgi:hypothetical protein
MLTLKETTRCPLKEVAFQSHLLTFFFPLPNDASNLLLSHKILLILLLVTCSLSTLVFLYSLFIHLNFDIFLDSSSTAIVHLLLGLPTGLLPPIVLFLGSPLNYLPLMEVNISYFSNILI